MPPASSFRSRHSRAVLTAAVLTVGCSAPGEETPDADLRAEPEAALSAPAVTATNAFYYYEDLEAAWSFYTDVLGFETVADFGFAKILQLARASFLTLVDETRGMHGAHEPKSVTLALVTEDVEGWYEYVTDRGVPVRASLSVEPGSPHDGFVAVDPEGYLLEFERFNEHGENVDLLPLLARTGPLRPSDAQGGDRPRDLGVRATVLWLYYDDLEGAQRFYEDILGVRLVVDQGWAKVYPVTSTGFLGLVSGTRGLHPATPEKAVTVSFLVDDIEAWHTHMQRVPGFEFRTRGIGDESGRVRTFVGYDVEGYYLEWDAFLDVAGNEVVQDRLERARSTGPGSS